MGNNAEKQWRWGAGGLRAIGGVGKGVGVMGRVYESHHVLC